MSILSSLLNLGKPQVTTQAPQIIQTERIAEEVAPFIKDILGKSQALYKQRMEEGFVPFEGQTLADVTADQLAAQEGLRSLVGTQAPGLQEARELTRRQTQQATAEQLQPFMNPYQQAVTDIAKRKAQERFEQETLPGLRKQAIDAGAFGGSRAAMRESQAQDAQARLLADIQAKGDLAAFQDARKAFEDQKTRERFAAEGLSGLTGAEFQARKAELGGLQAVGATEQQRQQQLLDESYQRFLQERQFPEQQLGTFQGFVAGASPFLGTVQRSPQTQTYRGSPIERALGLAGTGLGTYETAQKVGLFSKEGGKVEDGEPGGLRSIMIKIIRAQRGKGGDPRSKRSEEIRTKMQQEDVTRMLEEMDMKAGGLIDLPIIQRREPNQVLDLRKPYDEPGFKSQGERIADTVKGFLRSLTGGKDKEEEEILEEQPIITETDESNIPPGQVAEGEFGGEAQGETIVPGQNMTIPLQQQLDDTIASQVKPDVKEESPPVAMDTGIPSQREALVKSGELIDTYKGQLEERMNARLENIKASKEAAKAQARIDFLMGLGRGKRDPNDPRAFAGLEAKGQEAVAATKDFDKQIATLNQQELDVLDKNVQDSFNLESEKLNIAFKNGELTRQEFMDALEERKVAAQELIAGVNRQQSSLNNVLSILGDATLGPGRRVQLLKQSLANNLITAEHYRLALNNPDELTEKGDEAGMGENVTIKDKTQSSPGS